MLTEHSQILHLPSDNLPILITSALGTIIAGFAIHFALKTTTIRKGEPPLFPGALPLLGHVIPYGNDANKIYQEASKWSKEKGPVSLSLMGKRLYVVLNQKDIAAVWRAKTLTFESVCEWGLTRLFGMTVHGSKQMHNDPDGRGDMYENQHRFWRDALGPGEDLNLITLRFLEHLEANIEEFEKGLPKDNSGVEASLLPWTRDRIGVSATNALASPNLLKIDPKMMERLTQWESEFFLLALGLPRWVLKGPRDNLDTMIKSWMKLGTNPDMLPPLIERIQMVQAREASDWDVAAANLSLWLGFSSFPPEMRARLEAEIAPAFDPDTNRLTNLNHLIHNALLFDSIYWEVLRLTAGSVSVREVEEDTMIGGYRFCKGAMVMSPLRLNHLNEDTFGDDADTFVPDRFIRDISGLPGNKKNPGIKALKPFGGGTSLCPGRHFAINEILAFAATVMRKFDMELVPGQKVAGFRTAVPSVGTLPPDQDVRVRFRMRKIE